MICLNSGGNLVRSQVEERGDERQAKSARGKETPPGKTLSAPKSTSSKANENPVRRTLTKFETPFLVRGQTCPRPGDDESLAGRNQVCTWGDEVAGPRAERRRRPTDCDVPMRGRASTTDSKPDPETGVAPGFTRCRNMRSRCRCSMCPAIHINSRSWLRSSSTHEPSDPPLRVVSRHRSSNGSLQLPRGRGSRRGTRKSPHPFGHENSKERKTKPSRAASPLRGRAGFPIQARGPAL